MSKEMMLLAPCVFVLTFSMGIVSAASNHKFPEGLNLYCKQRSCYDVLELEETATSSEIKKAYRRMSLKYHPDKSDAEDAQTVFMSIATAYEVLSDEKLRKAYDDFLAHPERHVWEHYGHFYGAYYAPKSDLRLVIAGILFAASALQYASYHTRRARLVEVILSQKQGYIKKRVLELGGDKLNLKKDAEYAKWKLLERSATEEVLDKALVDGKRLSDRMGALDLLLMRVILAPLDVFKAIYWHIRWFVVFTVLRREYGLVEQVFITCEVIKCGKVEWASKDEEEREELLARELWIGENKDIWDEEIRLQNEEKRQEFVQSAQYKRYKRFMKKQ